MVFGSSTSLETGVFGDSSFLLPFFFVFAVTFALLSSVGKTTKVDALKNGPVNIIISLVFGFLAAGNAGFSQFFFSNGPTMIKIFVGLFIFAFLLEVLGLRGKVGKEKFKNNPNMVIIIGGVALLLLAVISQFSSSFDIPVIGTSNAILLLGLLFIIQMFVYAYSMGMKK